MADTKTRKRKRKSKSARKASDPTGLKAEGGRLLNIWYLFLSLLDEAGVLMVVASRLAAMDSARKLLSRVVHAIVVELRHEKEAAKAIVPKPPEPARRWKEVDGIIYFSLTSHGMTGPQWDEHFPKKGLRVGPVVKKLLYSDSFKPTTGVKYDIAVLKGELLSDDDRVTSKIRDYAEGRKFAKPPIEVACLIRDTFSDKEIEEMGLWAIIAMHEAVDVPGGGLRLLGARRDGGGGWLDAFGGHPGGRWGRDDGFAFVVPQVGA